MLEMDWIAVIDSEFKGFRDIFALVVSSSLSDMLDFWRRDALVESRSARPFPCDLLQRIAPHALMKDKVD